MPLCEHETRFNNRKQPGSKLRCGKNAGVYETRETLTVLRVNLCNTHLRAEIGRGRKFTLIEEPLGTDRKTAAAVEGVVDEREKSRV